MKFSLENKSAVVTGGGSGIGQAICVALAEQGATVHILELQASSAEETPSALDSSCAFHRSASRAL